MIQAELASLDDGSDALSGLRQSDWETEFDTGTVQGTRNLLGIGIGFIGEEVV